MSNAISFAGEMSLLLFFAMELIDPVSERAATAAFFSGKIFVCALAGGLEGIELIRKIHKLRPIIGSQVMFSLTDMMAYIGKMDRLIYCG